MRERLLSDDFRAQIEKLSAYTIKSGMEGAFAIYTKGHSKHVLPRPGRVRNEAVEDDTDAAITAGYRGVDISDLVYVRRSLKDLKTKNIPYDSDDAWKFRSDLDLLVHSHPLQGLPTKERILQKIRPSLGDLEIWETYNHSSPGFVDGTLVATDITSDLMLWRHDPSETLIPYYQQLEQLDPAARVVRLMRESGIRVANLNLRNMDSTEYQGEVDAAVEQLYP